ncbi:MAG: hypothetical protein U0263_22925 [Polyangiaceae bacterium]
MRIAQSYGVLGCEVPAPTLPVDAGKTRKSFARFHWCRGRHLLVEQKMARRDGTFFTVRDLRDPREEGRPSSPRLAALGFPSGRTQRDRYALISALRR